MEAQAWTNSREAQRLQQEGQYVEAWSQFGHAAVLFERANLPEPAQLMRTKAKACQDAALALNQSQSSRSSSQSAGPSRATSSRATQSIRSTPLHPTNPTVATLVPAVAQAARAAPPQATRAAPPQVAHAAPLRAAHAAPPGATPQATPNSMNTGATESPQSSNENRMQNLISQFRPLEVFFNFRAFSVPGSFVDAKDRIIQNISFFKSNYLCVMLIALAVKILTSFFLFLSFALICLYLLMTRTEQGQERLAQHREDLQTRFSRLPDLTRLVLFLVTVALFAYAFTSSISTLLSGAAIGGAIVLVHAAFFQPEYVPQVDERTHQQMDNDPEIALPQVKKEDSKECLVCMVQARNAVLIPCGHTFCSTCASNLHAAKQRCPMCRTNISRVNPLFI